jgi:four helix bundle protein
MSDSILQEKSYKFALRIVKLSQFLNDKKHEYVLSKKILDSGTAIGVLVEESRQGEKPYGFFAKTFNRKQRSLQDEFLAQTFVRQRFY